LLGPEEGETLTSWTERWLEGPVQLIAADEEMEFYASLQTVAERLQFIRLFWESRDPTQRDEENEFLEEFERRVAYANEEFSAGDNPGWNTAFGQVVLVVGQPDRTLRTSQGMGAEFSERPLVVWSYDRRITEWPLMENFIFAYRQRKWRLLPHTESFPHNDARAAQRVWELTSRLDIVPNDFLRVQRIMIQETTLYPANYRGAIDSVRAGVAFPDAEIPFGWEARFAPGDEAGVRRIDVQLSLRMEAFIFHADQDIYRTRMVISALLLTDDGEPVAETTEPIVLEVPLDELEARADEIVDRTISLQAPPGIYTLELVLEDPSLGYRTVYRETLEVPSS
jgi:GWxTD domain-containing protein